MRLSNTELKEKYCTFWNDAKHDIGEVQYGDTPLIHYDEKKYDPDNMMNKVQKSMPKMPTIQMPKL